MTATPTRIESRLWTDLGAAVREALAHPDIEDVMLNPDGSLWMRRNGSRSEHIGNMSQDDALRAVGTVAALCGTVVNAEHPILEGEIGGNRFECVVPPVSKSVMFAIRVRARRVYSLDEYVAGGALSARGADVLRGVMDARQTIVIAGGPASGKSTMLNACLAHIAVEMPDDRLGIIEDTPELQCTSPDSFSLLSVDTGEQQVTMLELVKTSMRLRPTRIIVGEVRGGEAYALLKAWNTGVPGGLATVHANSAAEALVRLEALVAEDPLSQGMAQQQLIAQAVNVVVFIAQSTEVAAGRVVREICRVNGWKDGKHEVENI